MGAARRQRDVPGRLVAGQPARRERPAGGPAPRAAGRSVAVDEPETAAGSPRRARRRGPARLLVLALLAAAALLTLPGGADAQVDNDMAAEGQQQVDTTAADVQQVDAQVDNDTAQQDVVTADEQQADAQVDNDTAVDAQQQVDTTGDAEVPYS